MDKDTVTLVAALVAAIASVSTVLLAKWSATALERMKWAKAREDAARTALGLAVAAFAKELSTAAHRIVWLLWTANNRPSGVVEVELGSYDADMKTILPQLFSALVLVAAHDKDAYSKLLLLANELYEIDGAVAMAAANFRETPDIAIEALKAQSSRASAFIHKVSPRIAETLNVPAPATTR